MSPQAIEVRNLHKAYGALRVLRGVDLDVVPDEVFGLLGPNGAGKTTLTHTILGLLKPDHGTIHIFGTTDPAHFSPHIGYVPERQRYHPHFTGREYLTMLGHISGLNGNQLRSRVQTMLDLVQLSQDAHRRIGTYSKGMLQRIGLAQAILHQPALLFIDEPASGLDPDGQRDMDELLQMLKHHGHTIFLCTHQLANIARLCDRIGVLVRGQVTNVVTLEEVYAQGHSVTITVAGLPPGTLHMLHALGPQVRCNRTAIKLYPASDQLLAHVLRRLLDGSVAIRSVVPGADALEQYYIQATRSHAPQPAPSSSPDAAELLQPINEDLQ